MRVEIRLAVVVSLRPNVLRASKLDSTLPAYIPEHIPRSHFGSRPFGSRPFCSRPFLPFIPSLFALPGVMPSSKEQMDLLKDGNTPIQFAKENPKKIGSKAWDRYEQYKDATSKLLKRKLAGRI